MAFMCNCGHSPSLHPQVWHRGKWSQPCVACRVCGEPRNPRGCAGHLFKRCGCEGLDQTGDAA
jgi:hypothetical protein